MVEFKPLEVPVIHTGKATVSSGELPPPDTFVSADEDWKKVMETSGVATTPKDVFIQGLKVPHYVK